MLFWDFIFSQAESLCMLPKQTKWKATNNEHTQTHSIEMKRKKKRVSCDSFRHTRTRAIRSYLSKYTRMKFAFDLCVFISATAKTLSPFTIFFFARRIVTVSLQFVVCHFSWPVKHAEWPRSVIVLIPSYMMSNIILLSIWLALRLCLYFARFKMSIIHINFIKTSSFAVWRDKLCTNERFTIFNLCNLILIYLINCVRCVFRSLNKIFCWGEHFFIFFFHLSICGISVFFHLVLKCVFGWNAFVESPF